MQNLYLQKNDSIMTAITFLSVFTHFTHKRKFYSDRTRKKPLLKRLKNIGMAFEKLYRNTLRLLTFKLNLVIIKLSAYTEFQRIRIYSFCRTGWAVIKMPSGISLNTA